MNPNPTPGSRYDLNDTSLGNYLTQHLPELKLPVVSTKIRYGQSNPTYFVVGTRYILRKKPSGTIISLVAHQADREYQVLEALGRVKGFLVPKVYCLCMGPGIIQAKPDAFFYPPVPVKYTFHNTLIATY